MNPTIAVIREEIDPRGRFIRDIEFKWLMRYFKDRYDPRRLILALCITCGLRLHDAVHAKRSDFNQDYSQVHIRQCKPSVKNKDGILRVRVKSRNMPLPEWLQRDLQNYEKHRLAYGYYTKYGDGMRMFPSIRKQYLHQLLSKLRKRYGREQPWLCDVWYYEHRIKKDQTQTTRAIHRISPHMGRAMFAIAAKKVCKGDLTAAKLLTGHERIKDLERYTRYNEVEHLKQQITDQYMAPLLSTQAIPLSKHQRTLKGYAKSL